MHFTKLFLIFIFSLSAACHSKDTIKINNSTANDPDFSTNQPDSCTNTKWNYDEFNILELNKSELPYINGAQQKEDYPLFDPNKVPLRDYHGKINYDPVVVLQYGLHIIDVFQTTGDSSHLIQLEAMAKKLIGITTEIDSSLFLPYTFDFGLHSCKNEIMYAPWYSAMSQAQALSFYSRLYRITGKQEYFDVCKLFFNSFLKLKGDKPKLWVSCVDTSGNLWLEMYPMNLPCFTFNGMFFNLFGLYDYYLISKNTAVKNMLLGVITTIKKNILRFRNENDVSYYCMKHRVKDLSYHNIVVEQLAMLYKITGDEFFLTMSNNFKKDVENIQE